jgi:DNA modification methylase
MIMQAGLKQLQANKIYCGDARELLTQVRSDSIDLSFWSPPYFVGKSYERDMAFEDWQDLLREVIASHFDIVKPGGFLAINIAEWSDWDSRVVWHMRLAYIDANARELRGWFVKLFFAVLAIGGTIIVALIGGALIALIIAISNSG